MDVVMRESTRRAALKLAGRAALVAFAGPGRTTAAQDASPAALPATDNGLNREIPCPESICLPQPR